VCIDRCTAKFFEVNKKVGERLQSMGGQAQATGSFGM
jgi:import inner membrane translocase subunit TIM10